MEKKKIFFYTFLIIALLIYSQEVLALEINYPSLPGAPNPRDLPTLISYFFHLTVYVSGFLILFSLIITGFRYFFSMGDPTKILAAKEQASSALLSLLLLFSSYLVLKTINPNLVTLEMPELEQIPYTEPSLEEPSPSGKMVSLISTEIPLGKIIQERILQRILLEEGVVAPEKEEADEDEKKVSLPPEVCQPTGKENKGDSEEEDKKGKPRMIRIKNLAENTLKLAQKMKDYSRALKEAAEDCSCSQVTPVCPVGEAKTNKNFSLKQNKLSYGYLFSQNNPPSSSPEPSSDFIFLFSVSSTIGKAPINITLYAMVKGEFGETVNFTFYCDRNDNGTDIRPGYNFKYDNISIDYLIPGYGWVAHKSALCSYLTPGIYTAKVIVEKSSSAQEARIPITVYPSDALPTPTPPEPTPKPPEEPTPKPPEPTPKPPEEPTPEPPEPTPAPPSPTPTPTPPTPTPPGPTPTPTPTPPSCPDLKPTTSPLPDKYCTCDPCKNVRGRILENQGNALKAIYRGLAIQEEKKEIITSLREEQRKAADEIRLLKEEMDKLERAEKFMFECGLSSLQNLSSFLAVKNSYLSLGWFSELANFWERIRVKQDWASFYCPVSGTIWEPKQPISSLPGYLTDLLKQKIKPGLLAEAEIPTEASQALACTIEMPVGEIIDRAKKVSKKIIERLEKLIDLDESLIKATNELFILVSQCSSTKCTPVCGGNEYIPGGNYTPGGNGGSSSNRCEGNPCPLDEIRNKYEEIKEIVDGKESPDTCGPCGDEREPHEEFRDECIKKKEKEGIKDIVDMERKKSIIAKRNPDCREQIGIKQLIDETVPPINKDLQLLVRDRMEYSASSLASYFANCSEVRNEIGPDNRLIKYCCYKQPYYLDCQEWCQYDTGFDNEKQKYLYKECMNKCLEEKEKDYRIPDISNCRNLLNFYSCSYK